MAQDSYEVETRRLMANIAELLILKHRDYGTGNLLNSPWGYKIALGVRLSEKTERLANLVKTGATPQNEALSDTITDIIGYATCWLQIENDTFTLPMQGEEEKR